MKMYFYVIKIIYNRFHDVKTVTLKNCGSRNKRDRYVLGGAHVPSRRNNAMSQAVAKKYGFSRFDRTIHLVFRLARDLLHSTVGGRAAMSNEIPLKVLLHPPEDTHVLLYPRARAVRPPTHVTITKSLQSAIERKILYPVTQTRY